MTDTAETFWFVQPRSGRGHLWAFPRDFVLKEPPRGRLPTETNWVVGRGDFSLLAEPPRFLVDNRGKTADLVWTSSLLKLVSTRLLEVLTDIGATGWRSVPMEVAYKNGEQLDGYHLLAVTGDADEVHDHYDPRTLVEDFGTWTASGLDVSVGWDGSDLFWSRGKSGVDFLATDRVVRAFKAAGLTGIEQTRSSELVVRVDRPSGHRL